MLKATDPPETVPPFVRHSSPMRPSTKAPLLAPLARRRTQLKEKGVTCRT